MADDLRPKPQHAGVRPANHRAREHGAATDEHCELGTIEPSCESGYCDDAATDVNDYGQLVCRFHLPEPVAGWPS